ncbi:acyltransferase family protein [Neobacillus dielmonensis]|uniref:acyltransferase family protein n=1 Tax=Neobacillus dielmonensis TaxID=1347369 RepID=UPI0005A808ED|nr:acyltransferase family protein [Neobacillus dielmonensis]
MSQRIQWVDTCKGIGIILVVIGHTMISGKSKSLLIPYVSFAILSVLVLRILFHEPVNIGTFLHSLLLSRRNNIYFDDPLWFLTSLFSIEVIYYFLLKYIKNNYMILVVLIGVSFFAVLRLDVIAGGNILPWSFDQSLYYIFYFGLGYLLKNSGVLAGKLMKSYWLIGLSILYILMLLFPNIYTAWIQALNMIHLPSAVVTYLVTIMWALIAISFVIYLSQFITRISILSFLGKNSLILLALHVSLGFSLVNLIFLGKLGVKIENPNFLGLFFTILAIVILLPVIIIINKYLPFILGKNISFKSKKI